MWVALALLLAAAPAMWADETPAQGAPLDLLKQAHAAALENLKSGAGSGTYEVYSQGTTQEEPALALKALFKLAFDGRKYFIRLDYEREPHLRLRSRTIICDGSAVLTGMSSPLFHPTGSQGELYALRADPCSPQPAGFPFNPTRLPTEIFRLDEVLQKHKSDVSLARDAAGNHVASYDEGECSCQFCFGPSSGYNVQSFEARLNHGTFLHSRTRVKWKQSGNVWTVESINRKARALNGFSNRITFVYKTFTPNAKVSSKQFEFESLELPAGSRILDQREGAQAP